LNLANGDNGGVGQLLFAPNMLHPGWNVSITTVDDPSMGSADGCDDNEPEAVSHVLEIQVTDEKGHPVKHFDNSFQLSLYAVIKGVSKDACLGYSNSKGEGWKCDGKTNINATGSSSVFLVDTTSDHLTSFAVLLGSSNNGCGWGWVEIASLVMIGSAIFLVGLITVLFCSFPAFRAKIRGRNEEAAIQSIKRAMELKLRRDEL